MMTIIGIVTLSFGLGCWIGIRACCWAVQKQLDDFNKKEIEGRR